MSVGSEELNRIMKALGDWHDAEHIMLAQLELEKIKDKAAREGWKAALYVVRSASIHEFGTDSRELNIMELLHRIIERIESEMPK